MRILFFLMASCFLQVISEPYKLVLVNHGESEWNKLNLFIGWTDVPLSEQGRKESIHGGKLLKERGYKFDVCYTSILKRAIQTAIHVLEELDQLYIPILKNFKLNDRHYGALQGLNKKETAEKYGSDLVKTWRRSYDIPPPALEEEDERNPANQDQYKHYPKKNLPRHESLKDTADRVVSHFNEVIFPDIKSGKNVLITAHGNSVKALIKHLDNISEQEFVELEIPNAIPLIYELDENLKPIKRYYLGNDQKLSDFINSFKILDANLHILIVDKLSESQEKEVWEILKRADNDFVPSLSSRVDTTHKFIDHSPDQSTQNTMGPVKYFEEIKKESFVLILNNGRIEGFMSFIKEYPLQFENGIEVCDYITTIVIDSHCRNKGYTKKMYYVILNERKANKIATRTWSTNNSHMHILDKLGFKLVQRDINDRGENIDTVYYLKNPIKDYE